MVPHSLPRSEDDMGEATEMRTRSGDRTFSYEYGPESLPAPGGTIDMWRYQRLLPRPDDVPRFPLPVGGTPLRSMTWLSDAVGVPRLWIKDETTGPSASNKDRATALVIDAALRHGATVVTTSSTGNAAVSTALGAAAAGLDAVIFVPGDCASAKVRLMVAAGAQVFRIPEGYHAAFELSCAVAARLGWANRNTGVNPLTVEAKKTVAFEIWEQLGRRAPDVVAVPVGDGATLVGMAKGFRELLACGAIAGLPRLIGVQAAGCAPLAARWHGVTCPAGAGATAAGGIAVPEPAIGDWTLAEVRRSAGTFVTVTDEQMAAAVADLHRRSHVRAELAGAASLAGLRDAVEQGLVAPQELVVALVTGAGLTELPEAGGRRGSVRTVRADPDVVIDMLAS